MPPEEKRPYEERAAKDRERYKKDMLAYQAPSDCAPSEDEWQDESPVANKRGRLEEWGQASTVNGGQELHAQAFQAQAQHQLAQQRLQLLLLQQQVLGGKLLNPLEFNAQVPQTVFPDATQLTEMLIRLQESLSQNISSAPTALDSREQQALQRAEHATSEDDEDKTAVRSRDSNGAVSLAIGQK